MWTMHYPQSTVCALSVPSVLHPVHLIPANLMLNREKELGPELPSSALPTIIQHGCCNRFSLHGSAAVVSQQFPIFRWILHLI